MPETVKEDPLCFLKIQLVEKYQKIIEGQILWRHKINLTW